MSQVAIITGGASGFGLATATSLVKKGGWSVHLVDMNEERGKEAAASLGPEAYFYKTNVTSYAELSKTFDDIFKAAGRLDFVFANAGVVERWNFYEVQDVTPPPEPDQLSVDVDLKSVVSTVYLAQHYFRLSKPSYKGGKQSLVMTASCGGLYSSPFSPMYTAAKYGVVGLMRAICKAYKVNDDVRVSCICPGPVRTNLADAGLWSTWPQDYLTPVELVAKVVVDLAEGTDMTDAAGVSVKGEDLWDKAVELCGDEYFFREMTPYCNDKMKAIMKFTDITESPDSKSTLWKKDA